MTAADLDAVQERRGQAAAPVAVTEPMADKVADCLTAAFDKDPVMNYFLRPDDKRWAARRIIMNMQLANYRANGIAVAASDASCAALWAKPGESADGGMGLIRQLALLPRMIRICGLKRLPRIIKVMDVLEEHHPKDPDHYYLFMLGVDPRFQGQGLGSTILEATLQMVDRDGLPAYLENSNPKNTRLYERYGFKVIRDVEIAPGGLILQPMWRDAQN